MEALSEEILKRFNESWIKTEARIQFLIDDDPLFNHLIPVYSFVRKLKQKGENKNFRIDSPLMHELIISRSVNHGLRTDQKYVQIEAFDNSFVVSLRDGKKLYREYRIKDLEDERLTGLLQTLKGLLID